MSLAVTAWAYFHLAAAPGTTARFDQTLLVPIVVSGLKPGFQARYKEKVATVVVETPRNGPDVKSDQVQVVLDVSDISTPGPHNVPLKLVSPDLAIKSLSPASVNVTVDRLEERTMRVSVHYTGEQKGIVVESPRVDPPATVVRGAASDLAGVSAVRVDIDLPTKKGGLDKMIRPTAIDANGVDLPNVQVSPNLVRVRAKFIPSSTRTK